MSTTNPGVVTLVHQRTGGQYILAASDVYHTASELESSLRRGAYAHRVMQDLYDDDDRVSITQEETTSFSTAQALADRLRDQAGHGLINDGHQVAWASYHSH